MREELKDYIAWYRVSEDEEDFVIVHQCLNEDDARHQYYIHHDAPLVEIHEITEDNNYLAYI